MNNKNEESDEKSQNIFELFDSFLLEKKRAYHSVQSYKTLQHCLMRYEAYRKLSLTPNQLTKFF